MGRHWAPMLSNMDSAKNAHTQTHVRIQAACTCTWATKEQMCDITHTHTQTQHTLLDGPHSRISYTYVQRVRRVQMCLAGSLHQWSVSSHPHPHEVIAWILPHDLNPPGKRCLYPPPASPQTHQYIHRVGAKHLFTGFNKNNIYIYIYIYTH